MLTQFPDWYASTRGKWVNNSIGPITLANKKLTGVTNISNPRSRKIQLIFAVIFHCLPVYIHGLMQEIRNSSVLAMELHLSCTNPSICPRQLPFMGGQQVLIGQIDHQVKRILNMLIHCGLLKMPYAITELGQHWFRASGKDLRTPSLVVSSSVRSCGI